MEKENGTTDINKFYLMGSQSQIRGEAAAPYTQHIVSTVAVVPRHATKTALAQVTVAEASNGSTMLKHEVCFNAKTKATCEAKPLKAIAFNSASFFLQVASESTNSKAVYEKVSLGSSWKVNGACDGKNITKCTVWHGRYGKTESDKTASNNDFWVTSSLLDGWAVSYNADAMGNATELTITKAKSGVAVTNKVTKWKSDAKAAELGQETTMGKTGGIGKHPSTVTYGWTVTKLDTTGIADLTVTWMAWGGSKHAKPFIVSVLRAMPLTVTLSEKAVTVDNKKTISQTIWSVSTWSEGEGDMEEWLPGSDDNRNSISAATADATNKNENVTSTTVLESTTTTSEVRVSQAFILQTADNDYKVLPKA